MIKQSEIKEFNKNINISYVDENLPEPDNKLILKHIICSLIVYFSVYIILSTNHFFEQNFLSIMERYYRAFLLLYIIFAPLIFFILKPKSVYKSHNIEICNYIIRVFKNIVQSAKFSYLLDYKSILGNLKPSYYEKQSLMLLFIKTFFGFLMINGIYSNILIFHKLMEKYKEPVLNIISNGIDSINTETVFQYIASNEVHIFSYSILILCTIDLMIFSFGYLTELNILKNKIRSVETTPMGVFFCLLCYPPFYKATAEFFPNLHGEVYQTMGDYIPIKIFCHIIALFFITIYVTASVSLGFKASNLTNRGTVSSFHYNIVRHPAYICKNIFWIFSVLPIFFVNFHSENFDINEYMKLSSLYFSSSIIYMIIYYVRAITEERHLMKDPEYREYAQKVKYRFIPGII